MQPSEFHREVPPKPIGEESIYLKTDNADFIRFQNHGKFFLKKKISNKFSSDIRYRISLKNEFDIGFTLEHPNIIRYFDFVESEREYYAVTEFIDGQMLSDFLLTKNETLTYSDFYKHILQLIDALSYLHSKQIYHLDIKPQNVMITHRGFNLKLIDFGLSCTDGSISAMGATKNYSAPEQLNGDFGPESDIYAFGKLVREYLAHLNVSQNLKSKWEFIVNKCVETNASHRYSSFISLRQDIEELSKSQKKYTSLLVSTIILSCLTGFILWLNSQKEDTHNVKKIGLDSVVSNKSNIDLPIKSDSIIKSDGKNNYSHSIDKQPFLNEALPNSDLSNFGTTNGIEPFTKQDSLYLINLGQILLDRFIIEFNKTNKSPSEVSKIQGPLTDSIQTIWFDYAKKYSLNSIEYKKAYQTYSNSVTKAQMEIMRQAFSQ